MSFLLMARGRGGGSVGGGGGSGVIFSDDFASADFTKTQNGCAWVGNTYCTVETVPAYISAGLKAARFNLGGPTPDRISQLDWELDQDYNEVWTKHTIYFPTGAESPTVGPEALGNNAFLSGRANKFFRFYPKAGNAAGDPRGGAQSINDGAGDSLWQMWAGVYQNGTTSELGTDGAQANGSNNANTAFLNDTTRGTIITIEQRFKKSTNSGTPNGEFQLWVNGSSVYNISGINAYDAVEGIGGGYLFGAQDSGWLNSDTYAYVPYFGVSVTGRVP